MDINLKIDATPALCEVLHALAAAMMMLAEAKPASVTVNQAVPAMAASPVIQAAPAPAMPAAAPAAATMPTPPAPVMPTAATLPPAPPAFTPAPPPPPTGPVPTAAPTYTLNDLMGTAVALCDAGKRNEVLALLPNYNVPALHFIPPERFGEFANDLRALGGKL